MTILPSLDFINKYTSNLNRDKEFFDIGKIFYNVNIDVLITKKYLDFLEKEVEDVNLLQSLIVELSDNGRLPNKVVDSTKDNLYEEIYNVNKDSIESLFAVTLKENYSIQHYKYSDVNKSNNKEYILFELLINNILSLHYYDFDDDKEIKSFFKDVFSLSHNCKRITIFNRYAEYKNLEFLKNKSIHYYNYIPKKCPNKKMEYINTLNDLKMNLGKNIILKSTMDKTKIHERKIFFNHFFVTTDQAFNNICVSETNWKIDIEIDRKKCYNEWIKKDQFFREFI